MRKIFLVALVLLSANAAAAELGDYCWYVAPGKLMRLSINEVGPGHFTLMGKFQGDQGGDYEINGHVRTEGGTLVGSFSGSAPNVGTNAFMIAIYNVTFDLGTLVGSAKGIQQVYHPLTTVSPEHFTTEYRTHTYTPTSCP